MKVWMFHLLNDYSGSPLILKNSVLALKEDHKVTVCTSASNGFLSDINGVNYIEVPYEWSSNKLLMLIRFLLVQVRGFMLVFKHYKVIDVVYINTLLPGGAALAAKLVGCKVIYHMHEPQLGSKVLFKVFSFIANRTANQVIFVSQYLKSCFPKIESRGRVIYNTLNESFLSAIKQAEEQKKNVLMLCSFKEYKGIFDFVALAKLNPEIPFCLVLNASKNMIKGFVNENKDVLNLSIYPSQKDVHLFYSSAKVVLNLSHPDSWIESFGMTALEAMAYGAPCIVPEVGGISELVGDSGYTIANDDYEKTSKTINQLYSDICFYESVSKLALSRSKEFRFKEYQVQLLALLK